MIRKLLCGTMISISLLGTAEALAVDYWMHVFDETDLLTSTADRLVIPQGMAVSSGSGEIYIGFRSVDRDGYDESIIALLSDDPSGAGWVDWAFTLSEPILDLASAPGGDLFVLTPTRMIRIDVPGTVAWSREHQIPRPTDATMLTDGNVVIVGSDDWSGYSRGIALVLDGSDGSWVEHNRATAGFGDVHYTTVARFGANGFVVGVRFNMVAGPFQSLITLYDQSDTVAWTRDYGATYLDLQALREDSNGDILAIGNTDQNAPTLVWRVNALDGSVMDEIRIDAFGTDIDLLSDGDIVIAGRASPADAVEDGWMARLAAADLSVVWERGYGGSSYDEFLDLVVLPGDRIAAAGDSASFGRQTQVSFVTVVDASGSLQSPCPVTSTITSNVDDPELAPLSNAFGQETGTTTPTTVPASLIAVTVRASEVCPNADWVEDSEEFIDECFSLANSMRGGEAVAKNFYDDQEDWVAVNLCEGRSYTIETSGLGLEADTILELYDPTCTTLIMSDDDSGVGAASRLSFTASSDGVHHFKTRQKITMGIDRGYTIQVTGDTSTCSVWEERLEGPGTRNIQDLLQIPNGRIVGAGSTTEFSGGDDEAWLFAVDQEGFESWSRVWSRADGIRFASIAPDIGGRFHVSGEIQIGTLEYVGMFEYDAEGVLQTADQSFNSGTSVGDIAVDRTLGWVSMASHNANNHQEKIFRREQTAGIFSSYEMTSVLVDEGFFGVAVSRRGAVFGAGKLDDRAALGIRLSNSPTNRIDKYSNVFPESSRFVKVRALADGTFLALGDGTSLTVSSTTDLRLIHAREDGALIWERQLGALNDDDTAVDIRPTFNGGSIILSRNGTSGRPFLTQLDAAGDTLWQRTIPQIIDPRSVIQTVDGGFVVAAQDGADTVLFRLNELGFGGAGTCSVTSESFAPTLAQIVSTLNSVSSTSGNQNMTPETDLSVASTLAVLGTCIDRCTDLDKDSYGDIFDTSCDSPTDCDDSDPLVYPNSFERCNGVDDDCDGFIPNDESDSDGDGFAECSPWEGDTGTDMIVGGGDCDDADNSVYPDAPERNDGVDNQCPGDEGFGSVDEISGTLVISDPTDKHLVHWPAQTWATQYEVARSDSPDFTSGCFSQTTTTNSWSDPTVPAPGAMFHYMVRSTLPGAGSWGKDSAGLEKSITCQCDPAPETCNNLDDNCDGITDNGPFEDIYEPNESCAEFTSLGTIGSDETITYFPNLYGEGDVDLFRILARETDSTCGCCDAFCFDEDYSLKVELTVPVGGNNYRLCTTSQACSNTGDVCITVQAGTTDFLQHALDGSCSGVDEYTIFTKVESVGTAAECLSYTLKFFFDALVCN